MLYFNNFVLNLLFTHLNLRKTSLESDNFWSMVPVLVCALIDIVIYTINICCTDP